MDDFVRNLGKDFRGPCHEVAVDEERVSVGGGRRKIGRVGIGSLIHEFHEVDIDGDFAEEG